MDCERLKSWNTVAVSSMRLFRLDGFITRAFFSQWGICWSTFGKINKRDYCCESTSQRFDSNNNSTTGFYVLWKRNFYHHVFATYFSLTVPKNFISEPFCVSEISVVEKFSGSMEWRIMIVRRIRKEFFVGNFGIRACTQWLIAMLFYSLFHGNNRIFRQLSVNHKTYILSDPRACTYYLRNVFPQLVAETVCFGILCKSTVTKIRNITSLFWMANCSRVFINMRRKIAKQHPDGRAWSC